MGRKIINNSGEYLGIQLQQHEGGLIQNILSGFHDRLQFMIQNCSQVLAVHLEVTWPDDMDHAAANVIIGECLRGLRKSLTARGVRSQCGWVREVSCFRTDGKPHFHVGLLLDGHEVQSGLWVAMYLNQLFTRRLDQHPGSIFVKSMPPNPQLDWQKEYNRSVTHAIKLRVNYPNAEHQTANILHWFSYLAKTATKGNVPAGIREFGFAQM